MNAKTLNAKQAELGRSKAWRASLFSTIEMKRKFLKPYYSISLKDNVSEHNFKCSDDKSYFKLLKYCMETFKKYSYWNEGSGMFSFGDGVFQYSEHATIEPKGMLTDAVRKITDFTDVEVESQNAVENRTQFWYKPWKCN